MRRQSSERIWDRWKEQSQAPQRALGTDLKTGSSDHIVGSSSPVRRWIVMVISEVIFMSFVICIGIEKTDSRGRC
jgi:hypothetical protein